jgi:protein-disulfide isomerase
MAKKTKSGKKNRRQIRAEQERAQRMRLIRIGGIVLLSIAAFAVIAFYRTSTAPAVDAPEDVMAANISGPIDAPVSIVEFGDFGCPSCRAWHNSGIKDALIDEFGDDISFTFRHFPVITRQSPKAAEAGQCASEQDQFWAYHDYIYEQTPLEALSPDQLKSYASAIGLDSGQFNQCLDSGQYASYVSRDRQAAFSAGAAGTPTFYINGQIVSFSYDSMAAAIQATLNS